MSEARNWGKDKTEKYPPLLSVREHEFESNLAKTSRKKLTITSTRLKAAAMSLSAAVVDGVGPGVEVNVLGRVSGESLGSGQSGLEGRLEGRLDWGSRGWPEGGLSWSGGLEGLLGRLLIAPDGNVGASVAAFGSGSANDVGTSAVVVDGLHVRPR